MSRASADFKVELFREKISPVLLKTARIEEKNFRYSKLCQLVDNFS